MWYVLQTMTGKEEELACMVRKVVPQDSYEECFVAYHERIWRRQRQSIVHVERLFPGYVFIATDGPKRLYGELKRVPAMSKLLSDGNARFLPIHQGEEVFLRRLLQGDGKKESKTVKLSYVETDGKGHVYRVSGPLEGFMGQAVKYQFKKRYAIVRFQMFGVEKTVPLGIILKEDVQQELAYGKVEAPVTVPAFYEAPMPDSGTQPVGAQPVGVRLVPGDRVMVTAGPLEHMAGVIWKAGKGTAEVGVRLFGQDIAMEVPVDMLCKAQDV